METSDRFPNHKYAFFIQSTKNGYFSSKEAPTWLKSIFSLQYRYWEGLLSRGGTASPGQSHLKNPIQNTQEIRVIPARFETPGMDAHARRFLLAQEIHGNGASHRQILTRMAQTDAGIIFPKSHIQNPMQAILGARQEGSLPPARLQNRT